jgi:cellulose biosynthesis protein BcsQ
MVDIDPQGNATMGCGINKHDLKKSTCELLLGECSFSSLSSTFLSVSVFFLSCASKISLEDNLEGFSTSK